MRLGIVGVVYLVVGLIVAANDNYLRRLETVEAVLSGILAILLWPLVLLGVDLHIE
jgi:hypothetical protein